MVSSTTFHWTPAGSETLNSFSIVALEFLTSAAETPGRFGPWQWPRLRYQFWFEFVETSVTLLSIKNQSIEPSAFPAQTSTLYSYLWIHAANDIQKLLQIVQTQLSSISRI